MLLSELSTGWFLSMKKEDSFFHRLCGDEPPFSEFNPKTLGIALVTAKFLILLRDDLDVLVL